ncbi:EndoU domain-containing protein [Micromonospora soli]|uniref:EndoU domain-containing protein n=1 Tax=Micromonospora sp. NBRC 110009 TaxID=3061627 RepID=UPI002674110D|nr:EndoU domain-containing protein [Micromonospora sp. NBRC 110009]WKU01165.1 EndoU domain-containing protein [Micromonospora sp. NBRC 110009]
MARPKTPHGSGHGDGPNPPHPRGDGDGDGENGSPSGRRRSTTDVPKNVSQAQDTVAQEAQAGRPGGSDQGTQNPQKPGTVDPSVKPTAPPGADDIHHSDASRQHILEGDGGRQGGHLAGTGFSKKTEFPKDWDGPKILDAAHQVTQQGPPAKGPYLTKDADGNPAWAYDYTGRVDGVEVKTTVLANGEIRTAYPPNGNDPGVITNPSAPNPAPKGVPMSNPPRYSHPDVGGDGSWTWEGPKGNKIVRVVQDAQGNVTTTVLGDYKKK